MSNLQSNDASYVHNEIGTVKSDNDKLTNQIQVSHPDVTIIRSHGLKNEMVPQNFQTIQSSKEDRQQAVTFQPLSNPDLTPSIASVNNGTLQPVPMFQTAMFEDGDAGQNHQGQTFLLTSSGNVLTSNSLQGQEDLVGVYLPTSSVGYSVSTPQTTQYVSTNAIMQSVNQSQRIILQSGSTSIPPSMTNQNQYILPVANASQPPQGSGSNVSINNKGHIVIKSGTGKVKTEALDAGSSYSDGVYRVVIRDGTTKITKPIQTSANNTDLLRQSYQTELVEPSASQLRIPVYEPPHPQEPLPETNNSQKLHECPNCNSKFIRPLYLRVHKRSCKKPETKHEKLPLYMCSFCKAIFKTKPQIHQHFTNCQLNPYPVQNSTEEVPSSLDPALEAAIQYKCPDCERTFNKERQFSSHVRRCTKTSFNDLGGSRTEAGSEELPDDGLENTEDPFADPPMPTIRKSKGFGGRRGRPPRKGGMPFKQAPRSNLLFDGPTVVGSSDALLVADNDNIVRSTTALAHTVQLTLETAMIEEKSLPLALVTDAKGVKGKSKAPQAWSLVCSLCKKMFMSKATLASHMMQFHGNDLLASRNILHGLSTVAKDLFKCPLCLLHYQSEKEFLEHLVLKHTSKLQDCYANLQMLKGSFVCSLCSIVLTTKSLLIEHISLEHLEDLQACAHKNKSNQPGPLELEDSWDNSDLTNDGKSSAKAALNDSNSRECCFCGEISATHELLVKHYVDMHEVETDVDGSVLDVGVDVDIKVKDTKGLLQMADSKLTDLQQEKTVLMKRQPRQSYSCPHCQHLFQRQLSLVQHMREGCAAQSEPHTKPINKDLHFFCRESQCSHLSFQQVKSLFKHMEEVHKVVIKKERRTFKTLALFQEWLQHESATNQVQFMTEQSRVEKGDIKLVQMVCERFHESRANQAREKEADLSKPTKKRLYVRSLRNGDCHARIHLRIEFNATTKEFDGETQMIYYPTHMHDEHVSPSSKRKNGVLEEDIGGVEMASLQMDMPDMPSNGFKPYMMEKKSYLVQGVSDQLMGDMMGNGAPVLIKDDFLMQDGLVGVNEASGSGHYNEEYVLPADESEWTKLFDVLKARVRGEELADSDRKEAQQLLMYQSVISMVSLQEQVSVFQKLCSLTNTAVDSM